MAVLPETDRARTWSQWMRDQAGALNVTKPQVRAAIDATDQWIEDNQAAYNAALPAAARTGLTLTQKTMLFCYVAMRRAGRLPTQED